MGCISVTSQVPDHCIGVTSQVPDHCINITSTERGECSMPIPVPQFEYIDSGHGSAEYDTAGDFISYENHTTKIKITNLPDILEYGLFYLVLAFDNTTVDTSDGTVSTDIPTKDKPDGSVLNSWEFLVKFFDNCNRWVNRKVVIDVKYEKENEWEYVKDITDDTCPSLCADGYYWDCASGTCKPYSGYDLFVTKNETFLYNISSSDLEILPETGHPNSDKKSASFTSDFLALWKVHASPNYDIPLDKSSCVEAQVSAVNTTVGNQNDGTPPTVGTITYNPPAIGSSYNGHTIVSISGELRGLMEAQGSMVYANVNIGACDAYMQIYTGWYAIVETTVKLYYK